MPALARKMILKRFPSLVALQYAIANNTIHITYTIQYHVPMPSNRSQTFLWRGELKERSCKAFEYLLSWLASREGGFFSQTILESMHLQPLKEMNSQPLMISIIIHYHEFC